MLCNLINDFIAMAMYMWERQNKKDMLSKSESEKAAAMNTSNRVQTLEARVNYLVSRVEGSEASHKTQLRSLLLFELLYSHFSLNNRLPIESIKHPMNFSS